MGRLSLSVIRTLPVQLKSSTSYSVNIGVPKLLTLKQISLAAAVTAIALSTLNANSAQAAIVGGRVTGIWEGLYDEQTGGLNIGDTFTADYTYDDSQILITDDSSPGFTDLKSQASLLSLTISSGGTVFQNFNPVIGIVGGTYVSSPRFNFQAFGISANDSGDPNQTYFNAANLLGNSPLSLGPLSIARLYVSNSVTGNTSGVYTRTATTFSGAFPNPTPANSVPTPALLPGLIGLGVKLSRKRRKSAAA
jgi:hypothetical protein